MAAIGPVPALLGRYGAGMRQVNRVRCELPVKSMHSTINPQSKLPDVGTTIFTVMSALAAEQKALNLSQGFPDFDGPPALLDRVEAHMRDGRNQYPPMAGVAPLREAIAAKVEDLYGLTCDPETEVPSPLERLRPCSALSLPWCILAMRSSCWILPTTATIQSSGCRVA